MNLAATYPTPEHAAAAERFPSYWTISLPRPVRDKAIMSSRHLSIFLTAILLICPPGRAAAQSASKTVPTVVIEYIAHACFRITSPTGKQVLIDPYASRVWLGYDFPPGINADAVLISHPHYDHDGGEAMHRPVPWPPNTLVLRQPGTNQIGD